MDGNRETSSLFDEQRPGSKYLEVGKIPEERIVRISRKDGTFETKAHKVPCCHRSSKDCKPKKPALKKHSSEKKPSKKDSDLRKTKSAKHSRKTLSREKSESIQKKKSPSVEKTKSRQTGDLSDCKVIENFKGKVKTILNENFGLIEFCLDLKYPSFCLFDTFDLFVETGLTAAQSKLTVGNVLSLEMEVFLMSVLCRPRCFKVIVYGRSQDIKSG